MNLLKTESIRSQKIYKNILLSTVVKAGSIAVSLLLVPLTIGYVNTLQYGIWLTISSVVSWMSFFDVGMANGLRNRLSHALAIDETDQARIYVSTTYAALLVISGVLFTLYWLFNAFIDWRAFLNIPSQVKDDIQILLLIVVGTFFVQLVAQIINSVLTAYHEPATAGVILFIGQLGTLITIYILKKTQPGTLSLLTITMTVVPIIVLLLSSIVLYKTTLKKIAPSLGKVKISFAKDLMNLGGVFFFIQIGALILLYTNNIVITKVLGPEAVTEFNVAYRLYGVVTMLFLIIVNPYWSAFTEAYAMNDFAWMRESLQKLRKIWVLLSLVVVPVIYLSSHYLFYLWVGSSVTIPSSLSWMMGLYTIGHSLLTLNSYLLNGIGKLKIQLILYCVVCVVNIPLSIVLGKIYGTTGVAGSGVIVFFIMGIYMWIQNTRIVNGTAEGIWNA
jgi:O-antigen/teichoic acid export membrane protein